MQRNFCPRINFSGLPLTLNVTYSKQTLTASTFILYRKNRTYMELLVKLRETLSSFGVFAANFYQREHRSHCSATQVMFPCSLISKNMPIYLFQEPNTDKNTAKFMLLETLPKTFLAKRRRKKRGKSPDMLYIRSGR